MRAVKPMKKADAINVYDFISEHLGVDKKLLSGETSYQSISEWDSFRHVNLMMKLEQIYGIHINEKEILKLTSINAIEKFINSSNTSTANEQKVTKSIHRGLNGVFFDNTTITSIDGDQGKLFYRGYAIEEIVRFSTYEEVCHLLIFGELPNKNELINFKTCLSKKKVLSNKTIDFIAQFNQLEYVDLLKSFLSMFSLLEAPEKSSLETGLSLIAKLPLVIAYQKLSREKQIIPSINQNASLAENFLSLIHQKLPAEEDIKILEKVMMMHADHGSNASSFVARVATGAEANFYSAIIAAICTFSGDLHGGALSKVIEMLNEIDLPENTTDYIQTKIKNGSPIYGYGHRVYRTEDPRAKGMRELAYQISVKSGDTRYFNILEAINIEMALHAKYGLNVNVDFYAAVIYHFLGIPQDMFIAVFIMSRMAGWTAQILEQESNNILIRPRLNYVGKKEAKYVLLDER